MSEEFIEQETYSSDQPEIIEENLERLESESTESTESNENKEVVEQPKKELPWKKEHKVPDSIPYSRFAEVNYEKRELERRLAEYEDKLTKYNQLEEKTRGIESIDELTSKVGEMDIHEYNKALVDIVKKDLKREREQEDMQRKNAELERQIMSNFQERVVKASEKNPDIKDAVDYLGQFASHIPAQTRYALLTDDHAGEVIYDIVTDKENLEFIMKANPIDVARRIARMSAKYDNDTTKASKPAEIKAFEPKNQPVGTPKVPGTSTGVKRKYSDSEIAKLSGKDYARARKEGRI